MDGVVGFCLLTHPVGQQNDLVSIINYQNNFNPLLPGLTRCFILEWIVIQSPINFNPSITLLILTNFYLIIHHFQCKK